MTGLTAMEQLYAEVLTRPERRRRFRREEKLRIVGETMQPGVSTSSVARRHGVHPNQVFTWRRQARCGQLSGGVPSGFVPVALAAEEAPSRSRGSAGSCLGTVEILLCNGRVMRARERIDPDILARLIGALERR